MRAVAWSLASTGLAAALLAVVGSDRPSPELRWVGAGAGGVLTLAGFVLGLLDPHAHRSGTPRRNAGLGQRFFHERRRAPRLTTEIPVRVAVNGHSRDATLLNVSSRGALLRLSAGSGDRQAEVGQPVTIEDYPAGRIARVGSHGIYVDFAVAFDPADVA